MFSDSRTQLITFGRVWYIFWYILFYSNPLNQFSKWWPPPSWIFSEVKSEGKTSCFRGVFFSLCAKFCANMFDNDWVVAIKVHFKMAAAAILDFGGIEFWHQNCLWSMVFSPCVKCHANICHSGRDIAIKPIFKMAAAAILNLVPSLFLAHSRIWIVFLYVRVKFRKSTSTGGWVIKFCQKFKMAAFRHLELWCGNAGPPTKSIW